MTSRTPLFAILRLAALPFITSADSSESSVEMDTYKVDGWYSFSKWLIVIVEKIEIERKMSEGKLPTSGLCDAIRRKS